MPRAPRNKRVYLETDRDLALTFFETSRERDADGRIRDAARRANVSEGALRLWLKGGHEGVARHGGEGALPITSVAGVQAAVAAAAAGSTRSAPATEAAAALSRHVVTSADALPAAAPALSGRPLPPEVLLDEEIERPLMLPAHDLAEWIRWALVEDTGPLYNEDHWHLATATLGVLWTNVENHRGGYRVLGTAEWLGASGAKWVQARQHVQYIGWFGEVPDFLITLDARFCAHASAARFCYLVEHEVYHCGVKRDRNGAPKFEPRTGKPVLGLLDHSVSTFHQLVPRYGIEAADMGVREIVEGAKRRPLFAPEDIDDAFEDFCCGSCG